MDFLGFLLVVYGVCHDAHQVIEDGLGAFVLWNAVQVALFHGLAKLVEGHAGFERVCLDILNCHLLKPLWLGLLSWIHPAQWPLTLRGTGL